MFAHVKNPVSFGVRQTEDFIHVSRNSEGFRYSWIQGLHDVVRAPVHGLASTFFCAGGLYDVFVSPRNIVKRRFPSQRSQFQIRIESPWSNLGHGLC